MVKKRIEYPSHLKCITEILEGMSIELYHKLKPELKNMWKEFSDKDANFIHTYLVYYSDCFCGIASHVNSDIFPENWDETLKILSDESFFDNTVVINQLYKSDYTNIINYCLHMEHLRLVLLDYFKNHDKNGKPVRFKFPDNFTTN